MTFSITLTPHPVLYADDTCSNISAQNEEELQALFNRDVNKAHHWMTANKLTINTDKSNALIISSESKNISQIINIFCEGRYIKVQKNVKYLGIWLDEKINFEKLLKHLERKIACGVGILTKLKYYFPKEVLLQLYHALIYLHLLYAIPI